MSNIFKILKYYFLSIKEKNIQKRLSKTTKGSYKNKTSKHVIGKAASLTLNSETLKLVEDVKKNVAAIVKTTNCDPEQMLAFIQAEKTPVYKLKNADKILNVIKEEEGFICEKRGFEALYLSIMTGRGLYFNTPPMFILRDGLIDKFYMLHNFYRWYSMKVGLPGFEYDIQKKLKLSMLGDIDEYMKSFTMEDIISIKEAISRDQEASSFVIDYTKEIEGSKKVIDKIKNEGGANI